MTYRAWQGFDHLLSCPGSSRVRGDIDVKHSPSDEAEGNKDEQELTLTVGTTAIKELLLTVFHFNRLRFLCFSGHIFVVPSVIRVWGIKRTERDWLVVAAVHAFIVYGRFVLNLF
jgi:hypothetical protein